MKDINLREQHCPCCKEKGTLYADLGFDSVFKVVKCSNCDWWTWLKNFNKKQDDSNLKTN